jgi:hypothetical protein
MKSASGDLVALQPTSYSREDELQIFIAQHPEILSSSLSTAEEPAPWLLIVRELQITFAEGEDRTRWSVDHLFIDSEAMPTLVEVKRSTDPRARREVVAQMLDYAASFRHDWTAERLRALWSESAVQRGQDPQTLIDSFLGGTAFDDAEAFWAEVQTKIVANQLRLLFVADRFSSRLVRIIEYLNEQLQTTEVVGLEVVPHAGERASFIAYVPTVRGRTSAVPPSKGPSERLTREDFDEVLRSNNGDDAVRRVAELVEAAEGLGGFVSIGTDRRNPRLFINFKTDGTGRTYWPLGFNSRSGKVAIQLRWLAKHPAFEDEDRRTEIVSRLADAIGEPIEAPRLDGFPGFPVRSLGDPATVERVTEVLRWITIVANDSGVGRGTVVD